MTTVIGKSTWISVWVICGIVLVSLGFEAINWERRQNELEFQAGLILRRSIAIATETRGVLRAAVKLKTKPCSPEDIAALHFLVSGSAYLVDVGRIEGRRVLCDSSGTRPSDSELRKPDRISRRGAMVWLHTPLRGDWRINVTAAANHGIIVFSRPAAAADLFEALGDATATVSPPDVPGHYMSSDRPGRLAGAEYTHGAQSEKWFDHRYAHCAPDYDICVAVAQPASWRIPAATTTETLGLLASGLVFGMLANAGAGSWFASRRTLHQRLKRAIGRDLIVVHYQPLVSLKDRKLTGFEALARWRGSKDEDIPPDVFIPIAEQHGLLAALTERVASRALADLSAVLAQRRELYVSINIAIQTLLSPNFRTMLDRLATLHGVDRRSIVLEITERETGDVARIGDLVKELRDGGYRVFLDDFGTGYSSLAYLATLPIDTIKLDKLFSRSVGTSLVGTLVLREICRMMMTLGLSVIFEGIETEDQARVLEELAPGAIGQGWLFGRPVPLSELTAMHLA